MSELLHILDERISKLQKSDLASPDYWSQLASLKRDRNRLIPVGRLPFETLSAILEIDFDNTSDDPFNFKLLKKKHLRLAELSTVCAYWRDVVEGTARFWRKVDSNCPLKLIRKILSKQRPLEIYRDIYTEESHPYSTVRAFFKAAERWEEVDLGLPWACVVALEKVGPVPILTKLSLEVPDEDSPSRAVNIFKGEAPRLKCLELARVAVPWNSPLLKNLSTLKMTNMDRSMAPSIQELLSIISACPTLAHFQLQDSKRATGVNHALTSIDAPNLSELVLSTSMGRASSILRYLQAPVCRQLHLTCRSHEGEQPVEIFHPKYHRHFLDRIQQHVEQDGDGSLNLWIGSWNITCRLQTTNFSLSTEMNGEELEPVIVLNWLSMTLGRASHSFSTSINLVEEVDIADETLFRFLNTLPETKSLSYFPDEFDDATPLICCLKKPDMFPHLESLELQFCWMILRGILKMVEMRCGRRPWTGQGHIQTTPFKELHLDHPQFVEARTTKNNIFQKIRDILGERQATIWESDDEDEDGGEESDDDEIEDGHDPVESVAI